MLSTDPDVLAALRTHQTGGAVATAFYMGTVTVPSLNIDGSLHYQGDAEVQCSGQVVVTGPGPVSLVPKGKTDSLAVYGQELSIRRTVEVEGATYEIPLGRFRNCEVPDSATFTLEDVVQGWSVTLQVSDRFEQIQADDFLSVDSPQPGNDTWAEIRRLAPVPVQASLPAVPVPPATVYDSRLGAIRTLCDLMGGLPHLTREGVLTARPKDAWLTATVPVFDIRGVIDWNEGMKNDYYNQVQVKSSSNNDLVTYRQINDVTNPLAVSRAGGRTYKYSSPLLDTQVAVDAAADTVLQRVSSKRSRPVLATCGPEALLLELGDYGRVEDTRTGRYVFGEVFTLDVSLDPTAPVKVQLLVAEEA